MAESFAQGLLTNLLTPKQAPSLTASDYVGITQSKNPLAAMLAAQIPQTTQAVGQGVRGMLGGIMGDPEAVMTTDEALRKAASAPGAMDTAAGLAKLAQQARAYGKDAEAVQLSMMAAEMQKTEAIKDAETQRRKQLADRATEFGLTAVAEDILAGGDLDDARAEVFEAQRLRVLEKHGRPGRLALATSMGAPPDIMQQLKAGELDSMSDTSFLSLLEGSDAELKFFTTPDNKTLPLRVSEAGKVFNPETGSWVEASSLGLTPLPVTTRTINEVDRFGGLLWEGEAKNFTERSKAVSDATDDLALTDQLTDLISSGMVTGKFASWELGFKAALLDVGLIDSNSTDADIIRATQTYAARVGERVGKKITMFGAGTGLSDADRKYAEGIAAGDITMTEEALKNIIAMDNVASRNLIAKYNDDIDELMRRGIGGPELSYFKKGTPLTQAERRQARELNTTASPTVARNAEGLEIFKIGTRWFDATGKEYK